MVTMSAKYSLKWYKQRKQKNLCVFCPQDCDSVSAICTDCKIRMVKYSKMLRARRINEGVCADCGKERGIDGTRICCRHCADLNNKRMRNYRLRKR